ncbi:MAG: cysteine synthase A [Ignavibacteriae bacterium HGW-Ignavibacteriae-1]|jgi:cysteine synthase A|nr:MAG: cysteine synthase A [Ignavibacteriae bacterium HGW-Ignavibacteriae-1]
MKIANNIGDLIGNTPLVRINKLTEKSKAEVVAKLEYFNPASSIKDRIAWAMITDAENMGQINKETTIIEPTSGNTGIGLAFAAAVKGYKLITTMPESMSIERRKLISGFGAEIVLTPASNGMKGAIQKAQELAYEYKNSFIPQQFQNLSNPEIHRKTTAEEIWRDTDGKIDILVAGVGTGGTITGVSEVLKARNKNLISIAVEPFESQVLAGQQHTPHKIQGIGAGFIPDILNREIIDEIIAVSSIEAIETAKRAMKEEGLLVGISSGAVLHATLQIAERPENEGKLIVCVLPDTGERYLSTDLFSE